MSGHTPSPGGRELPSTLAGARSEDPSAFERARRLAERAAHAANREAGRVVIAAVVLTVVALAARLFDLDNRINIDAVKRWQMRTNGFWDAVQARDFAHTFQSGHPGVTFMWLAGGAVRLFGLGDWARDPEALRVAKLPIAILGGLLAPATYLMLRGLLSARGGLVALLTGLLIATEPLLVAHSRSLHLDMLVTGFAWLAVLASALCLERRSLKWAVIAGVALGLAGLTKVYSAAVIAGIVSLFVVEFIRSRARAHDLSTLLIVMGATTVAVILAGWPALLLHPIQTLTQMTSHVGEGMSVGGKWTRVYRWGELTEDDPGLSVYGGVALMKVSAEVLWPAVLGFIALVWHPRRASLLRILWMSIPLAALLLMAPRKGQRYILMLYPLVCLLAATTIAVTLQRLTKFPRLSGRATALSATLVAALLLGRSVRLWSVHPLALVWCAGYPGLPCEEVLTLGWGEGMKEVAQFIKSDSTDPRPTVYPVGYGRTMAPWLDARFVRRAGRAQYLISYLSEKQRNYYVRGIRRAARGLKPIFTLELDGRTYAEVYKGPRHRDYPRSPRKKKKKKKKRPRRR